MSNQVDQQSVEQPGIRTPFRVVDDGHAFTCEVVTRIVHDDGVVFYYTSRIYGWELVVGVGPITEPRPYDYDLINDQLTELTYQGASAEYIRADPEVVGRAWLRYRKQQRNPLSYYLSALLTRSNTMTTNTKKPLTYWGDVFQSKGFNIVMAILAAAILYTGSLKLFADWHDYNDPFSAKGTANIIFYAALVILIVCFLIPLISKERRATRAATRIDASGFYPGQPIVYRGPESGGRPVPATYVELFDPANNVLRINLGGPSTKLVPASTVFLQ